MNGQVISDLLMATSLEDVFHILGKNGFHIYTSSNFFKAIKTGKNATLMGGKCCARGHHGINDYLQSVVQYAKGFQIPANLAVTMVSISIKAIADQSSFGTTCRIILFSMEPPPAGQLPILVMHPANGTEVKRRLHPSQAVYLQSSTPHPSVGIRIKGLTGKRTQAVRCLTPFGPMPENSGLKGELQVLQQPVLMALLLLTDSSLLGRRVVSLTKRA
jgi:hypothetical protein